MSNANQPQNAFHWIATAYDSDKGFAIGNTPEQAQSNYLSSHGEPAYGLGFSIIRDRSDYKMELVRVAEALGYSKEKSIPLAWASHWIVVARITLEGLEALKGRDSASHLVSDWSREDGEFFITAEEPKATTTPKKVLTWDEERALKADIQPIQGIAPSLRQKEWAAKSPWKWKDEMAWAHQKGDISLTPAELIYVRSIYGLSVTKCGVNPVYRLRDARTQHAPTAGADLVKLSMDAGLTQAEIAKRCGVSREYIRLLSAGDREISYAMQVLLEDLALTRDPASKPE
ncbi:helix-turn-helix domain-containing protein [Pseudomonas cichorii]|nr:helix-turn-helix transcriptional regulator [Pseudomonas cichorii]MBX8557017.1 helix-turn-helix domain-containing protein [Pseudomonas cichorii]MBX8592868.1 helix-turn-helix domain-containing protein [Pseudomonas cichorii]